MDTTPSARLLTQWLSHSYSSQPLEKSEEKTPIEIFDEVDTGSLRVVMGDIYLLVSPVKPPQVVDEEEEEDMFSCNSFEKEVEKSQRTVEQLIEKIRALVFGPQCTWQMIVCNRPVYGLTLSGETVFDVNWLSDFYLCEAFDLVDLTVHMFAGSRTPIERQMARLALSAFVVLDEEIRRRI